LVCIPQFVKVNLPVVATWLEAIRVRVEGNVDGCSAIEGDGWQILIEEGLEHDHFVPMLKERGENGILSCK
jgi:hypothetical protein